MSMGGIAPVIPAISQNSLTITGTGLLNGTPGTTWKHIIFFMLPSLADVAEKITSPFQS